VVDGFSTHRHVQRLAVEPRSLACAAGHLHVGHEIKLGGDYAFSLALLASAALDVEAEASGLVAALHRQRRLSEEIANVVVEADVGGGVGAAVAADGRLIDADHFMYMIGAVDAIVLAGKRARFPSIGATLPITVFKQ